MLHVGILHRKRLLASPFSHNKKLWGLRERLPLFTGYRPQLNENFTSIFCVKYNPCIVCSHLFWQLLPLGSSHRPACSDNIQGQTAEVHRCRWNSSLWSPGWGRLSPGRVWGPGTKCALWMWDWPGRQQAFATTTPSWRWNGSCGWRLQSCIGGAQRSRVEQWASVSDRNPHSVEHLFGWNTSRFFKFRTLILCSNNPKTMSETFPLFTLRKQTYFLKFLMFPLFPKH